MNLNKIVNSRGEALRKELLKTETSREDKQKTFESLNSGGSGSGSGDDAIKWEYYKVAEEGYSYIKTTGVQNATYKYINHPEEVYITYGYISEPDYVTKIACANIPMYYAENNGFIEINDSDSWKTNMIAANLWNESEFDATFIPITKEEFYSFES